MGELFQQFYIKLSLKKFIYIALFALIFWGLGILGLQLQSEQHGITPFWPASGFTFAAFFIFGFWLWPGVVLGLLLIATSIDMPVPVALFSAVFTILESSLSIIIARRYKFSGRLDTFRDNIIFAVIVVLAPVMTALLGVGMIYLMSAGSAVSPMDMIILWWLGNSLGILLLGGFLLSLYESKHQTGFKGKLIEKAAILLAVIFVFLLSFTQKSGLEAALMVNLIIPLVFIASIRFNACGAVILGLVFVVLISFFSDYSNHSVLDEMHLDFQFLILIKIWLVSISGLLIAGAFKDNAEHGHLAWLALHDGLTGLENRMAMEDAIDVSLKGMRSSDNEVCLLFLDVDNFKPVNDELGHKQGDELLVKIAQVLKVSVRHIDVVSRWGGDEFIILLRQCSVQQAMVISNKIITGIQCLSFEANDKIYSVSISIGIANAILGETDISFVERADAACYVAKNNGRNQSAIAK